MGDGISFYFLLFAPHARRLWCFQTPGIIVVIVMLEVAVVAIDIISLVGLVILAYLSAHNLILAIYCVPPKIVIYPPIPDPYGFDLNPIATSVLGLRCHQSLGFPLFSSFPGFLMASYFCLGVNNTGECTCIGTEKRGVRGDRMKRILVQSS